MREADVLLWLSMTNGVGAVTVRKLAEYAGSYANVWDLEEQDMVRGAGVRAKTAQELCRSRTEYDPDALRGLLTAEGVRYVAQVDREYPEALKALYDPPAGLFVAGELPPCGGAALAVVGSRTPTHYGQQTTQVMVAALAAGGLTIVSGLARGIDTVAHEAVMEAGGQTVAVLGSGLLKVYPQENRPLAHRIADGGGAVISEFHPLTDAKPGLFPVRNRIIAGLCKGTLIVEAGERSGSLITADLALELGRDVFAVPGPIFSPQSAGTNRLLQQGAKVVTSAGDVFEEYGEHVENLLNRRKSVGKNVDAPEAAEALFLLEVLGFDEVHADVLLERTGWPISRLHTWLLRLQVEGRLTARPGGRYARVE